MKSKTSCFNYTIFKKNITHFWPIWTVLFLFYFFLLPFAEFNVYLNEKSVFSTVELSERIASNVMLPEITNVLVNPVLLFLFSMIAAGAVFHYLYTSRSANMIHALPVTRRALFITNFLSGLAFLWVPQVMGVVLGILVAAGCGFSYLDVLFQGMLFALGISFFFFSFHVFIGMFVGQLTAMPVFSTIVNFLFVGGKFFIIALISVMSYGVPGEFWASRWDALSPLYFMVEKIGVQFDYSTGNAAYTGIIGGRVVAGYALAAVVLIVCAYILYQKRNVETVGNLISVTWMGPVFRWGVGFCGAVLFALFANSFVSYLSMTVQFLVMTAAAVVFGIVFFFCAQMFLEKGFRVFRKKRFQESGIFAVILVAVMLLLKADVFGVERKVPDVPDVKEAYINSVSYAGGKEQEDISEIIELHREILKNKPKYSYDYYMESNQYYWVNIRYYLKNGSTLTRNYNIPVEGQDAFGENSPGRLLLDMVTRPETYIRSVCGMNYEENEYQSGSMQFPVSVEGEEDSTAVSSESKELTKEQAEALCQAFLLDVREGNFKEQIENGMRASYDEYEKELYWSTIQLSYTNPKGYETYSDRYYYAQRRVSYVVDDDTVYINFNPKCRHIIQTLIDEKIIESQDELRTSWEIEQLENGLD